MNRTCPDIAGIEGVAVFHQFVHKIVDCDTVGVKKKRTRRIGTGAAKSGEIQNTVLFFHLCRALVEPNGHAAEIGSNETAVVVAERPVVVVVLGDCLAVTAQ